MHRRRSAYTVSAVVALAVAAPLLTGCGSEEPRAGAAAVVDGERITTSQLQARTEAVRDAQRGEEDANELLRAGGLTHYNLGNMISTRVVHRAAADEGVSVTRREVQQARATAERREGGKVMLERKLLRENALAPSQIDDHLRTNLLFTKLLAALKVQPGSPEADKAISTKLVDTSKKMGVKVSPRYGSWDYDEFGLADDKRDWIKPATEAAGQHSEGDGHDH